LANSRPIVENGINGKTIKAPANDKATTQIIHPLKVNSGYKGTDTLFCSLS
jgi:hypothetical protein